jgi:hypothetical protein
LRNRTTNAFHPWIFWVSAAKMGGTPQKTVIFLSQMVFKTGSKGNSLLGDWNGSRKFGKE